jgi:peptidyl-prolyl cis-trans isomerase D
MQVLAGQARSELVRAPQDAQQIATKLGLLHASVDNFKTGDTLPEIGSDAQLSGEIASMQKGAVSDVMQSGEKLVIAEVTAVNPPRVGQFNEVEAQVRDRYQKEHAVQLVTEKSKKAAELAKSSGDLKPAAKALGVEVKTTAPFNRTGAAEGIGDARYLGDAFDKPVGTIIGPVNVGTQTVIAKIVERIDPDVSKIAQERNLIVDQLKGKKVDGRSNLMGDSILDYLIRKGKVKIHQDVLDRLRDRYRS